MQMYGPSPAENKPGFLTRIYNAIFGKRDAEPEIDTETEPETHFTMSSQTPPPTDKSAGYNRDIVPQDPSTYDLGDDYGDDLDDDYDDDYDDDSYDDYDDDSEEEYEEYEDISMTGGGRIVGNAALVAIILAMSVLKS